MDELWKYMNMAEPILWDHEENSLPPSLAQPYASELCHTIICSSNSCEEVSFSSFETSIPPPELGTAFDLNDYYLTPESCPFGASSTSSVAFDEDAFLAAFNHYETCPDFIAGTMALLHIHGDGASEVALQELINNIKNHAFKAQPGLGKNVQSSLAALQKGISYYQEPRGVVTLTAHQLNSLRLSILDKVSSVSAHHVREIEMWLILDKRQAQDVWREPFHLGIISPLATHHYRATWQKSMYAHAQRTLWILHQPGLTEEDDRWLPVLPDFAHPVYSYAEAVRRSQSQLNPFKCEICTKTFSSQTERKSHQKNHGLDHKNYRCEDCGLAFRWPKDLRRHLLVAKHAVRKIIQCPHCSNKNYSRNDHLVRHIKSKHPGVYSKTGDSF